MNIQHLEYALEISRAGSISRAAENLYMGQPNLSKALKELEVSLGFLIFTRNSKGVFITPKGQEFMRYARSILHQLSKIETIGQSEDELTQSLRLCVARSSYIAESFASLISEHSFAECPLVTDFRETNSVQAITNVSEEHCELAIIRYQVEHELYFDALLEEKKLDKTLIWDFDYQILLSREHPLAQQDELRLEQLRSHPEVLHGDLSVPYNKNAVKDTPENSCSNGNKVFVYSRGSQFDLLSKSHSAYMWVAPMPEDILGRNRLTVRKCSTGTRMKDALVLRRGYQVTEIERRFLELLTKNVKLLGGNGNSVPASGFIERYS